MPTEGDITTQELDKLICEISAAHTGSHNDYSKLAARVAISSFNKTTNESFYETMLLANSLNIVSDKLIDKIKEYGPETIQNVLNFDNDNKFDYFGWKALENTYLLKNGEGIVIERPQHMFMRIALSEKGRMQWKHCLLPMMKQILVTICVS